MWARQDLNRETLFRNINAQVCFLAGVNEEVLNILKHQF